MTVKRRHRTRGPAVWRCRRRAMATNRRPAVGPHLQRREPNETAADTHSSAPERLDTREGVHAMAEQRESTKGYKNKRGRCDLRLMQVSRRVAPGPDDDA